MKLVAGCGNQLVEGEKVVVTDYSLRHLRRNRERNGPGFLYVAADLRALPFKSNRFQEVECIDVLEHLDGKSEAVAELARVAAPCCRVLVSAALAASNRFLGRISRTYRRSVTNGFHRLCAEGAEYEALLTKHFTIDRAEYRCCGFPIVVTLLLDALRVGIEDSGEYTGRNRLRLFAWSQFLYPFLQPLLNRIGRRYPEHLTQSAYFFCRLGTPKTQPRRALGFSKPLRPHLRSYLRRTRN